MAALAQSQQFPPNASAQYSNAEMMAMMPQTYAMQQGQQYQGGRQHQFEARLQHPHQQYVAHQYPPSPIGQRPPMSPQGSGQFGQMFPYPYGAGQVPVQQLDPRFAGQPHFVPYPSMPGDVQQFMRGASEPAPIPSYPRGPPRKPKQSGHALWVGNLPLATTVVDLKEHFSRDATQDIESVFLISKSNCAFVNYCTQAACIAATARFHDSRFHGVRLVCRLRRGTGIGSGASPLLESPAATPEPSTITAEERSSPTIVGSSAPDSSTRTPESSTSASASDRALERFFIVKSLTVQDLESSVRNGVWATQAHNEGTLNRAYEEADAVYLLFSANKSGEYFGYAKMTSKIAGEPVHLGPSTSTDDASSQGAPQSIPTPATTTAPKGHIIDDSARGTIFWEADLSESEREESPEKEGGADGDDGQNWGRQFSIEWVSTARLPFYRTRGLRNPLNDNREVKIARDGTELDPAVGRRLIQMFHRLPTTPTAVQPNMPIQ